MVLVNLALNVLLTHRCLSGCHACHGATVGRAWSCRQYTVQG